MAEAPSFSPALFAFLRELKDHNDRAWFNANKARYEEEIKEPALAFIEDFGYRLPEVAPHLTADKRSLFRIYRDTRFSKDKTPYKTHVGIQFRHERNRDVHAPGFYLHLEPDSVFSALIQLEQALRQPGPDQERRITAAGERLNDFITRATRVQGVVGVGVAGEVRHHAQDEG